MRPAEPRDRGAGSVLVLVVSAVLVVGTVGVGVVGQVVAARHRVEAAADEAALAAAGAVRVHGPAAACGQAARVAGVQGATLGGCHVDEDGSVKVVVTSRLPDSVGLVGAAVGTVTGRARAGPAVP